MNRAGYGACALGSYEAILREIRLAATRRDPHAESALFIIPGRTWNQVEMSGTLYFVSPRVAVSELTRYKNYASS
jgi:hypothetical protein